MKQKVRLSTFSVIITILSFALLVGISLWQYSKTGLDAIVWILFGVVVIWGFFCLFYSPLSIEATDEKLYIHRPIRIKEIPLSEIKSAVLCPTTLGERRICGSGGCFGYWGWFSERDIGKYFAYYGRSSECFLLTLKNNRKYMLGCQNAPEMVNYINSKLK